MWGGADGGWVTPIAPRAGRGDARARGGGGIRSPRDARAHLVRSGGAVGGVHGLVANATHLRGRLRELPGFRFRVTSHPRASGCCFLARPSVATAGGVDRGDRRDRRDPFGGRNPVDRASPGYRPRRTAGERVAGRGAPPGEFGKRALRAEKDRFRLGVQSASRASFYRFSRSVSRAKWRERHPLVAPDRSFAKGRGEKVVDTPRVVSIVGGGGTPRRPSPARRTRRRPVRRCRARAAMARLRRVPRSRTTRSQGR